jgi:hypothetical protein
MLANIMENNSLTLLTQPNKLKAMTTTQTNNENKNANILISSYGSEIAVGIEGTKEQINQQFNRFFNVGAAAPNCTSAFCSDDANTGEGYLHFTCDTFAYFLSTEEDMIKGLVTEKLMQANSQSNPQHKGKKGGILAEFQALAEKEYSEIKREGFMLYKTSEQAAFKKLDGGAPSLDMSSLNFFSSHAYL